MWSTWVEMVLDPFSRHLSFIVLQDPTLNHSLLRVTFVGGFKQGIALQLQNTAYHFGLPKWSTTSHLFGPDIDLPPTVALQIRD